MVRELAPIKEWHGVTETVLQEKIIPAYQPAILKNIVGEWTAIKLVEDSPLTLEKYREAHQDYPDVATFKAKRDIEGRYAYGNSVDEFNFQRLKINLKDLIAQLDDARANPSEDSSYAGAIDLSTQLPLFLNENKPPECLRKLDYTALAWIGNSASISSHFDISDNIACLVSGKREFMLFPPEQLSNLYPAPFDKYHEEAQA